MSESLTQLPSWKQGPQEQTGVHCPFLSQLSPKSAPGQAPGWASGTEKKVALSQPWTGSWPRALTRHWPHGVGAEQREGGRAGWGSLEQGAYSVLRSRSPAEDMAVEKQEGSHCRPGEPGSAQRRTGLAGAGSRWGREAAEADISECHPLPMSSGLHDGHLLGRPSPGSYE